MTAIAPSPVAAPAARWRRVLEPGLTIGLLGATTLALHLRDPHQHGSWGLCPSYALLGVYCPGCGGLRAVNDLTDGHVGAAASSNLVFVLALPLLVAALLAWFVGRWRGSPVRMPARMPARLTPSAAFVTVATLTVFTVLRNLPGSWLAP